MFASFSKKNFNSVSTVLYSSISNQLHNQFDGSWNCLWLTKYGWYRNTASAAYINLIDRGPLAKIISFRGTHLGNTWFMVYLKDI